MRLSAPVYSLKRQARLLSRKENIPLHQALDRVAAIEGFADWGLLLARAGATTPAGRLFALLTPGDLVLVGARPGHGKTLLSLELAVEAMKSGCRGVFFTLEYTQIDVLERFRAIGVEPAHFDGLFEFDNSDAISANYIVRTLEAAPRGTLVVIDYLQLLDQKRENPDLMTQVRTLKSFARDRGLIFVFISQIDRSYDPAKKPCPDISDVRLPNPLDLSLFNKTCFLNQGELRFQAASSVRNKPFAANIHT
ncbi:replicative DNA helicase [Mesorhizobium sp. AR10]|uniref:DNA helicase n=1 Tax=Mesorhizobium sp. AR10 TaxID=2865839 RepID=UPI00215F752F|nr:DNA helicase [Mesorhizobium sp. AR10]UVK41125.1 replicative DNA helicase [Mesorhizobium sp. AR10]